MSNQEQAGSRRSSNKSKGGQAEVLKEGIRRMLENVDSEVRKNLESHLGPKIMALVSGDQAPVPTTVLSESAKRTAQEEQVRQQLREAVTESEIESALEAARALEMSFEVTLGEKKLSKMRTSIPQTEARE